MGENFYNLTEESKDDLIELEISDGASFDISSIKNDIENNNFNIMNEVSLFVINIFERFANMYGSTIIGKDFEEVKFKIAITSLKGLVCKELSIKDFAPLSTFDNDGNVTGFIGSKEMVTLNDELTAADEAAKKLRSTGGAVNNAAIEAITTKITTLNNKLVSKYMAIIETFFNLLKVWGEVEKVSDIWDVTVTFNMVLVDNDNPNEAERNSIVKTDICCLHDIAHKHLLTLKTKFD
jgi:hypothetical protein